MVPIGCPETSFINYHYCLRNNPEERGSQTVLVLDLQQFIVLFLAVCLLAACRCRHWYKTVDAGFAITFVA